MLVTYTMQEKMVNGRINSVILIAAILVMMISATPVADPSNEQMPEPLNSTLTEEQDQEMNKTEDAALEGSGSGDSSDEPVNCTCNEFDCSNCGWKTNLLPNATTPMAIIPLYTSTDETADYLRKYFCKIYALKIMLHENMYDVSKPLTVFIYFMCFV